MTEPRRHSRIVATILLALLVLASGAAAQLAPPGSPVQEPTQEPVTSAEIQAARDGLAADTGLDEETRQRASTWLEEAAAALARRTATLERIASMREEIAGAEQEISSARLILGLPERQGRTPSAATPIPELGARLDAERQRLAKANETVAQLEAKVKALPEQNAAAPARLDDLRKRLAEGRERLAAPPDETTPPAARSARRLRLRAEIQATGADIQQTELEQSGAGTLTDLYETRLALARRRAAEIEKDVAALQKALNDQRVVTSIELRAETAAAVRSAPEPLADYAATIREAAESNLEAVRELRDTQDRRQQALDRYQQIDARLAETKRRIGIVGLTEAMGLELRRIRREQLADADSLRREAKSRRALLVSVYEKRFAADDVVTTLGEPDAPERMVARYAPDVPPDERPALAVAARDLVGQHRRVLTALIESYDALTDGMLALDSAEAQLTRLATQAADYVDERVLWIVSAPPVWRAAPEEYVRSALAVLESWADAAERLLGSWPDPAPGALLLIALILLILRPALRRALDRAGETARRRTTVRIRPTLEAMASSVLLALPLPIALFAGSVHLAQIGESRVTASALTECASVLFALSLLWQMCRSNGLGPAHFGWPETSVAAIRRQLRWLTPLIVVMLFISTSIGEQPDDAWRGALGRWSLVLPMLGLVWFLKRLVAGDRSAFSGAGPWDKMARPMRFLVTGVLVGLPIVLSILALLGYTFTVNVLYARLLDTLLLLLVVVVGRSFVLRILLLASRQVIVKQTRERLRLAQAAASGAEPAADAGKVEAEALDLAAVDQATRQLTRAAVWVVLAIGAWSIWVDFLPAIRVLDTVELWMETAQVTETITDETGATIARTVERLRPVTLANLLGALALTVLTWIAARNIPGFLEIVVLQKTRLRAGERYAITSLARYAIVLVGGVVAFSVLGIGWSQIQWLVAGVSVGLGFGLQEIFANFVSGVILLFERPVRVGDTVTVGDTDGVVTRIQMRATTVRNWDRHELVIPNKDFVTQKVVNWSLSDTIVRLLVKVGVAYGSNPEQVRQLLEKAARSVPVVVQDPAPSAVFRNFGDNALEFELRAFIASMDDWLAGMNGLHDAVARELGEAGIEISFPQRDLHVRSIGPFKEILAGTRAPADETVG